MANKFTNFDMLAKHSHVNSKTMQLCFPDFEKNLWTVFKTAKKIFFWFFFICNSLATWCKYITSEFSNGMDRVAIQNLIMFLYQTLISPLISARNTLEFTSMPYLCHHFLAVRTFVINCFEGWRIVRVKFCQKSLNTLKGLWELQPLSSKQTDALISQKGAKRLGTHRLEL